MLRETLPRLIRGEHLTQDEARSLMLRVLAGEAGAAETGALLTALTMKGETVEEVAGFAQGMREGAEAFPDREQMLVDTCGTGGDRSGTFNISTTAAFVVAGAGLPVVKHGNRSVTSKSGSADVLEALGVLVDQPTERAVAALDAVGITFLYAPRWNPAMRHVAPVRRELPFPTVFNLLGPLVAALILPPILLLLGIGIAWVRRGFASKT